MSTVMSHGLRRFGVVAPDPLRFFGLQAMFGPEFDLVAVTGENGLPHGELSLLIIDAACTSHLFELIAAFRRRRPGLKLVVVGLQQDFDYIEQVIGAGAKGYLTHEATEAEIRMAIEIVLDGSVWAPRKVLARLIDASRPKHTHRETEPALTPREADVLRLLVGGRSNREIGRSLSIDEATVKAHVGRLMRKVGVSNRTALTVKAMEQKLLPTEDSGG